MVIHDYPCFISYTGVRFHVVFLLPLVAFNEKNVSKLRTTVCILYCIDLSVSISPVIGCEDRLRYDLGTLTPLFLILVCDFSTNHPQSLVFCPRCLGS